nr:MAG TPA: hypothetical protein [Caudoviricetes sp.]
MIESTLSNFKTSIQTLILFLSIMELSKSKLLRTRD